MPKHADDLGKDEDIQETEAQEGDVQLGLSAVPSAALWLGLAGLIPFASGALAVWTLEPPLVLFARDAMAIYGAIILSFMGGCRWGFASAGLGEGPSMLLLTTAVAPAIFAWAVVFTPPPQPFFYLALGFGVLLAADIMLTRQGGAPTWWPALRWPLSVGAVACLSLAGFA